MYRLQNKVSSIVYKAKDNDEAPIDKMAEILVEKALAGNLDAIRMVVDILEYRDLDRNKHKVWS